MLTANMRNYNEIADDQRKPDNEIVRVLYYG